MAYGVGLFLSLQFLLSYSYKLSPFNQIFLLTSLHSKILHKSTISETSDVNSVTISRDGQTIVSHSQNNEIKVRNLKTGNLINTIGIPKKYRTVFISPDGQTAASMGKNGVQMWNLKTGSLKTPLPYKGKQGVSALAFSPDGQTLVSNSYDSVIDPKNTNPNPMFRRKNISNIEIWNLSTGKLKTAFPSEEGLLNLVAISSDGKTVVSSRSHPGDDTTRKMTTTMNTTIKIWDVNTGKVKTTLADTRSVYTLTISPDGQTFVTLSENKTLKIWDLNTGKLKTTLPNPNNNDIYQINFSPDGQTLLTSSENDLKIWNLKTGSLKTTLAHSGFVRSFAISLDGQTLASNSGGTLLIWDLKTGKYKTAFVDPNNTYISSVAISPDGQTIVSSYWKSNKNRASIKIWQMP